MKAFVELIKIIVISSLILISACVHPQYVKDRQPAEVAPESITALSISASLQADLEKLEGILRSRVVPLDRDLVTFNYQSDSRFTPRSMGDVQNRLSAGWAEKYFNINAIEVDLGPGQYAAMDPFSSRWYGREKPQLYVITLAKGAVILDVTKDYRGNERFILEEMYQRLNCGKPEHDKDVISDSRRRPLDFDDMIGRLRTSYGEDCRRLIIRSAQDLGIQGILYNLESVGTLAECRHNRSQAINIIRHDAIRMDDLAYYDDNSKIEGKPISGYVARLYQESILDPSFRRRYRASSIQILGGLKDTNVDLSIYSSWKRDKIFRCGPSWFSENHSEQNDAMELLYQTYFDHDLLEDLAKINDAFSKRFLESQPTSDRRLEFDLSRMHQIEKLEFAADTEEDSLDFEEWKQEADSSQGSEQNYRDLMRWLKKNMAIIGSHGDSRSVIPEFYFESHFGSRLARIRANSWIIAFQGIPFLSGLLPHGNSSRNEVVKLVHANKKIYLSLIRTCTAQYADLRISDAEIQNGPCGIRPWPQP